MSKQTLTQERLKELLDYDKDSGSFTYLMHRGSSIPGQIAGSINKRGYVVIGVEGNSYYAHRLAWLYLYGRWPKYSIDHIDGNLSNNRPSNLRDVPHNANMKNMKIISSNKSGQMGVWWSKRENRWKSYIDVDNKRLHLGTYHDYESACDARICAEEDYGFHTNHGRIL